MQFNLDSPALVTARLHFRGQMILIFLYLLDWLLFVAGGIQVRDYNTDIRAALPLTAADFQGLARHAAMRPYWCFCGWFDARWSAASLSPACNPLTTLPFDRSSVVYSVERFNSYNNAQPYSLRVLPITAGQLAHDALPLILRIPYAAIASTRPPVLLILSPLYCTYIKYSCFFY